MWVVVDMEWVVGGMGVWGRRHGGVGERGV